MSLMASQITSLTSVYPTMFSGTDQRKRQSSASLAFMRGFHRWPVNSPHKKRVTPKMLPFDEVILNLCVVSSRDFNLPRISVACWHVSVKSRGTNLLCSIADLRRKTVMVDVLENTSGKQPVENFHRKDWLSFVAVSWIRTKMHGTFWLSLCIMGQQLSISNTQYHLY